jgi:predicted ester cyclase
MHTTDAAPRDAVALGIRGVKLMTSTDLADFRALVHPRARNHEAIHEPPACREPGPAGVFATAQWLRSAYSDLTWEIHQAVADDDLVVVHTTMSGRHTGTFVAYDLSGEPAQAFPPTGRRFAVTQTHWFRVADGLLIGHWANRDDQGQAQQLGWIPPTPGYLIRMAWATRRARREHRRWLAQRDTGRWGTR